MWGKTQVSIGTFGIYEQTNITVFAMTVAGSSAIPWRPPEAALYLGVIELCTSRLLFQSHDTLPPIILVAEPLNSHMACGAPCIFIENLIKTYLLSDKCAMICKISTKGLASF